MGMSAAQAKLLSLTARRSDINYQLSSLMRGKLDLMTQASNATDMLSNAQRNNNIFVMTTSDNTQTELSFNSLSKEGLTIVDAKGRTIVPSSYQTNPNKLASILPTSHPSIKSYDGDFIVKEKIKKNYVSMPQNTIPMYSNSEELEQKVVKATNANTTEKTQYIDHTADIQSYIGNMTGQPRESAENLADYLKSNSLYAVISNKDGDFLNKDGTGIADNALELNPSNRNTFAATLLEQFKTETSGINNSNVENELNKNLGASYTAYADRKFQTDITWTGSLAAINEHRNNSGNQEITYVSNAEQLITALLKDATCNEITNKNGQTDWLINSDANIMLLNDIDLDEMLGDKMKSFIETEIKSVKEYENTNFPDKDLFELSNDVDKTKTSSSGITLDVLQAIWNKYFSNTEYDQFNEDFTNFIQIDEFSGSIGGGGFAINNLKMFGQDHCTSMFGTLDSATIHGIWMDNANVFAQRADGNNDNKLAAILAQNVKENTNTTTLVTAKGNQVTFNNGFLGTNSDNLLRSGSYTDTTGTTTTILAHLNAADKYQNYGIIANDYRKCSQMSGPVKDIHGQKAMSGWSFYSNSYSKNSSGKETHYGWRSSAKSGNQNFVYVSSVTGDNSLSGTVYKATNEDYYTGGETLTGYTNSNNQATNVLGLILNNSGKENSKIKIYAKEDVDIYDTPTDDSWKNTATFEDGTQVDWNKWDIIEGSFNSETGEYTLVKKHGEETEEYLEVMSLLEFYKEQGVNVEFDEDKDSGFLTYSFSGYSVDVEYKDDLEKFYSDPYLYKVENGDSSIVIYEREKIQDVDMSQLLFVDDIESVLSQNIKNGIWFLQGASIDDPSKYERKSLDEIGIVETDDENANAIAQAEYEKSMRDIELKEEKLDAQITELESTLKAVEQEIENQEKIIKQNIQSGFSTFAS